MSETGTLQAIWKKRAHGGVMDAVDEAVLEAQRGMVGDANRGLTRQITMIEGESWSRVESKLGVTVDPSARRANLLVSGISLRESRGKIIQVGRCRIRIQGETRPCQVMDEAHPGLREALIDGWGGGAFGEVLEGGTISVGDPTSWVEDHASDNS